MSTEISSEEKITRSPSRKKKRSSKENVGEISNRRSGFMSLRPNRRVDVSKDLSENDFSDESTENFENENNLEKTEKEESVYFKNKGKKSRVFRFPIKKFFSNTLEESYVIMKESLCAICCKELNPSKLSSYKNLFTDVSNSGKVSLIDLFSRLIESDVLTPDISGSYICHRCFGSLENVENHYIQYRQSVEAVVDAYQLGHQVLESDAGGRDNKTISGMETISSFSDFIDVSDMALKVNYTQGSNYSDSYQSLSFDKIYRVSFVTQETLSSLKSQETEDDVITLTFDINTGNIERSFNNNNNIGDSEIRKDDLDVNIPVFLLSSNEFESSFSSKVVLNQTLFLSLSDFDSLSKLLVFKNDGRQLEILSINIAEEYHSIFPILTYPFICDDCTCSTPTFHELFNHLDSTHHITDESFISQDKSLKIPTELRKTGERPSLEKPFQCEHCEKCFSEYLFMSTHIEHYHGYHRRCNIENCNMILSSIQEFTLHYVRHGDKSFTLPPDFINKTKIVLPCPQCSLRITGVWKFFAHTYTHDTQPRFKCPVCFKRTHKVQNFREHLLRHKGSQYKNRLCPYCDKVFFPHDLHRHVRSVHGSYLTSVSCSECGESFSSALSLQTHCSEAHSVEMTSVSSSPSPDEYLCNICDTHFSSESILMEHLNTTHLTCSLCTINNELMTSFNNEALTFHYKDAHGKDYKEETNGRFHCMDCGVMDKTLLAARKHYRLLHRDKPFNCNICKSVFNHEGSLHSHLKAEHFDVVGPPEKEKEDKEEEDKKKTKKKKVILMTEQKTFQEFPCVFCDKVFKEALSRYRHLRFIHLVESIDIREMEDEVTVIGDQIAEYDESNENIIKLHSIP